MKKWIRVILYIAAGCVGAGCAALATAYLLSRNNIGSADDGTVGWAKKQARDLAALAEKKINNWEYVWDDEDSDDEDDAIEGTAQNHDDATGVLSIEAEAVQNLDIHLRHGTLNITEADTSQIWAGMSKPDDDISVTCEDGRITITDNRKGKLGRKDAYVYLEIPEGKQFEDLNIQIDAGTLETDVELMADHMVLNADAGVITADGLWADDFSASVGAGTIEIEDGSFGNVKLACGVGTIDMDASINKDSEIKCGMGTVDLTLENGVSSVNYELSCGMGVIEIGSNTYTSLSRKQEIKNGASATFKVDCGMGEIDISD